MVSSIDTDRIELTKNVENALKRLVRQTLVQKNGDVYVFLTNEEQEINREIKAQNVETAEVINKVSELIFDGIYEEKKYKYPAFNGRYAFGFNQFVDDRPYRNNQGFDINLKFLMPGFMGTDENMLRMMSGQGHSVIVVLPEDFAFRDEITDALKIEKYLRRNITNTLAKYKQVKDSKKSEMSVHNSNAKLFLEDALKLAEIYVNGDKSKFVSKNISARITDAIGQLVTTVFHKLYYIDTPMGEANIRQLLKGSNQPKFKLESEQICNKLALSDAADFINDNTARHTKTSMKSIIERFTKAPYGFIEDDVQWLIAKLFKDGDIALFVNNESISLLSKSEDEILRYLSKHEFADKLLIETRERPTDRQKKAVREVMKELFNSKPTSDDDDAIMNSFHQYCSNLKTDLEKIEIRQNNQIKYPGRLVISKGKSLLINVLDIKYSTEFFMEIDAKRDEYLDFAEGYQPLKAFFGGEQIAIFDKAINLMNIYDDSKTFIVNEEIEKVVSDIKDIMKKSSPYSEIFKMPELLDKFTGLYRIMLDEMEEPVISSINEAKTRVFAELGQKQCHDILKNSFIRRFEEINDKAAKCNNVATLQNIKIEADALKVRLLNEIASEENKILAAKAKIDEQNKPKNIPGQAVSPTVSVPKVKKQKTISIKQINLETTWQIETEQDIDHYVTELKTRLRKALEDDTVINIEF